MRLNPHDLSELLYRLGYYVDDETGEVVTEQDLDDSKAIFELLGISCTKS